MENVSIAPVVPSNSQPHPLSPPASSSLWKRVALGCFLVLAALILTQDLTGRLIGKKHQVKLAPASPTMPEMAKPRYPSGMPQETHLLRQVQIREDGRQLRGPYRTMQDTRSAGPGSYMLGDKTFWVVPFKTEGDKPAARPRYEVWIPKPVPHWLRWPVYLGLILLLKPKVRQYYQNHPLGTNKLPYLEALRGIACLVVVVTHFVWLFYREINLPIVEGKTWYDFVALHRNVPFASLLNAGGFAVDTFFVLSGFVLFLPFAGATRVDVRRILEAIVRRPVRLLGVMALVMLAVWLLRQSGIYFENSHVPPKHWTGFLGDLLIPYSTASDYCGVFWTIRYELWGSFLIYGFALLLGGRSFRWFAYPILIWLLRWDGYAGFVFGALLADLFKSYTLPTSWNWVKVCAPALFTVGLLIGLQMDHDHLQQGFDAWLSQYIPNLQLLFPSRKQGLVGAVLVVSALLLSPWLQRRLTHPWLNSLGRQSYAVYGVHNVIIYVFSCWLLLALVPLEAATTWYILPNGGWYHVAVLITFVTYLVATWGVALAVTAFVDEPCIRIAQRFGKWVVRRKEVPLSTTDSTREKSTMTTVTSAVGSPDR
ncbi:peptidoglycan/LPS O-acetylase OafA/YrhL [Roseimicrobium gellanilyticum]|uniref:Peptidoglycan/LPS O-acetylase OafA/YrhL n=1 Tax=Roseimicrobium gellanilyticum TaxID=748857 RepID=A0A366HR12_9BACT|nr:acyltransferase [Roseimicrobium gellanilyticum]RBP46105.1 peptidoglycan/LPS O-acetylase OafA/YrhL [Roseimicrobium gellanilyticum]